MKMILQLLISVLLPCLCTGCTELVPCNSSDIVDGICIRGTCWQSTPHLPRDNLSFIVVIRYPESVLEMHSGSQLYIRGSGLGQSWNKGTVIQKTSHDTWRHKIVYTSSIDGYHCQTCADKQPLTEDKLEYRILVDDRIDMVGANFAIDLPISKVSGFFHDEVEVVVHPWFFQRTGNLSELTVQSHGIVGNRNITVYTPPSFSENSYKTYPTIFVIDFHPASFAIPQNVFDDTVASVAVTEEFVAIGFGDYTQDERMKFLIPTEHDYVTCINGTLLDSCDHCFDHTAYDNIIDWFEIMTNRCGKLVPMGGGADAVIDFLLDDVFPTVQTKLDSRLSTNKRHVGVMGYSLGGLFSCYAAWTRPSDFGLAACQSSSFWWPVKFGNNSVTFEFEFLRHTIQNISSSSRPPQRLYLDAGDMEQEEAVRMAGGAVEAAEKMTQFDGYVLNQNVWVNVYPGASHNYVEWQLRMWKALKSLLPVKGKSGVPVGESISSGACTLFTCLSCRLIVLLILAIQYVKRILFGKTDSLTTKT